MPTPKTEIVDIIATEMLRRFDAREKAKARPAPELHWIRLIAIGMAIANPAFAKKMFNAVDKGRAFGLDSEEEDMAAYAENMAFDPKRAQEFGIEIAKIVGIVIRDGERLSDAIIRVLAREDMDCWEQRNDRAMSLYREASAALAKLMTIARGKSPQRLMAEGEID